MDAEIVELQTWEVEKTQTLFCKGDVLLEETIFM